MRLSDVWHLSVWRLTSVWRMPVAYIGPKSRTERPRKTKIGTGVAYVTHVKVKRSKVKSTGRFTHRGLNASGSCSGERGNVLGVGNYCYVAVCSAAPGASVPTEGGEGRGHIVTSARLQLLSGGCLNTKNTPIDTASHRLLPVVVGARWLAIDEAITRWRT